MPSILPKRGFTLIELLVVIAMIAVLASLLLSGLSRAKQAADNVVCRNNLRQQALGLAMYVGDFGVYPLYRTAPFSTPNVYRRHWPELLHPYVKDKWPDYDHASPLRASPGRGIFACPAYNKVRAFYQGGDEPLGAYGYNAPEWDTEALPSGGAVGLFGLSSSIDPQLFPRMTNTPGVLHPISEAEVVSPSRMIAIGDTVIYHMAGNNTNLVSGDAFLPVLRGILIQKEYWPAGSFSFFLSPPDKATAARHGGRWNMVFCDGHSEHGKTAEFFKFTDDSVVRLWNRDNLPHRIQ